MYLNCKWKRGREKDLILRPLVCLAPRYIVIGQFFYLPCITQGLTVFEAVNDLLSRASFMPVNYKLCGVKIGEY